MKDLLKMDSFMGRACRTYELEVSTKADSRKDPSMGKATLFGRITAGIKVLLSRVIWMAKELITGLMALSTRDIGVEEKCRDKEPSE